MEKLTPQKFPTAEISGFLHEYLVQKRSPLDLVDVVMTVHDRWKKICLCKGKRAQQIGILQAQLGSCDGNEKKTLMTAFDAKNEQITSFFDDRVELNMKFIDDLFYFVRAYFRSMNVNGNDQTDGMLAHLMNPSKMKVGFLIHGLVGWAFSLSCGGFNIPGQYEGTVRAQILGLATSDQSPFPLLIQENFKFVRVLLKARNFVFL